MHHGIGLTRAASRQIQTAQVAVNHNLVGIASSPVTNRSDPRNQSFESQAGLQHDVRAAYVLRNGSHFNHQTTRPALRKKPLLRRVRFVQINGEAQSVLNQRR